MTQLTQSRNNVWKIMDTILFLRLKLYFQNWQKAETIAVVLIAQALNRKVI